MLRPSFRSNTAGEVQIASESDGVHTLSLPATDRKQSYFILSIYKAGSSLFNKIVVDLARESNAPTVSVPEFLFKNGIARLIWSKDVFDLYNTNGYIFCGFRTLEKLEKVEAFSRRKKLVLLRDPRDILTSLYFSRVRSHTAPGRGSARKRFLENRAKVAAQSIDDFVRSDAADGLLRQMRRYICLLEKDTNTILYRYEDIVFEKRDWAKDIADQLDLALSEEAVMKIADRHDLRPEQERADEHVRQVAPGNYRKHLSIETIHTINEQYRDVLDVLNYSEF